MRQEHINFATKRADANTHQGEQRDTEALSEIFWRSPLESLHDVDTVAAALGVSRGSLGMQRMARTGIPYILIGRLVRYRKSDVLTYIDENRNEPAKK